MKSFVLWSLLCLAFVAVVGAFSTWFPGTNPTSLRKAPEETEEIVAKLTRHIEYLAQDLGTRDKPGAIDDAATYLAGQLRTCGPEVKEIESASGRTLVAEVPGTRYAREVVLVCSHFDGPKGSPGADAGASGAAALVEIARALAVTAHERTLRFVLFPDGALRGARPDSAATAYAKECATKGETIASVVYLDSLGLYADKDTQSYPFPLGLAFPSKADFIGVVGGWGCRDLTARVTELMRMYSGLPVQGLVLPQFCPGAGFSPHDAFWDAGFPAAVITDTGSYRSALWGTKSDTHDRIDYVRLARVVLGLTRTVGQLVKKATVAA